MRPFTLRQLLLLVLVAAIEALVIEKRYLSVRRLTDEDASYHPGVETAASVLEPRPRSGYSAE